MTETWLNEAKHMADIENFNFIYTHRKNRLGGGVGFYLSNELQFRVRDDLHFSSLDSIDALFVEVISFQKKHSIVGVIYRPPNQSDISAFIHEFDSITEKISREHKHCSLIGDFKINLMNYQHHNKTSEFLDNIFSNMLYPHITCTTRITAYTASQKFKEQLSIVDGLRLKIVMIRNIHIKKPIKTYIIIPSTKSNY